MIGGCVPADVPPQLAFTAGPPVQVTDQTYSTELFTVDYPAGWRIITAPAESPDFVTFAAPDDRAVIILSLETIESLPALADVPADRVETFSDGARVCRGMCRVLNAALVTDRDNLTAYRAVFDKLLQSAR